MNFREHNSDIQAKLDYLLTRLRPERSRIEKIILFGSAARGEVRQPYDLDVAILVPSRERFPTRQWRYWKKIHPTFALDLLVYTPEEFKRMLQRGNAFAREIQKHGKVIYAKKPKR
jgi:predicted nucleotidyltransferase